MLQTKILYEKRKTKRREKLAHRGIMKLEDIDEVCNKSFQKGDYIEEIKNTLKILKPLK